MAMQTVTPAPDAAPTIAAILLPPDARGRWGSRCARHSHDEAWPSRQVARIALAHVPDWCPACGHAGGRDRP